MTAGSGQPHSAGNRIAGAAGTTVPNDPSAARAHRSAGMPSLAVDSGSQQRVDRLMRTMTFCEKVGQLNQRLLGWKAIEKRDGRIVATDTLKREIDRWGGLGLLYGLYRADPWSGRDWANGITPQERPEAFHVLQSEVISRGAHGIGALLSEEAPHGHQALGGTILPTNLALGATFDPQAVQEAQSCVAAELAASGVHIALVSGLDIARDPRWGRCEECYGEDPFMAARFVAATVRGMQGENRSKAHTGGNGVAVVLKHLAAQGEAVGGRNGQSAVLGPRDLRQIHLPPVAAGVRAGAFGFMAAYNDIDSVPCCANPWLLQDYLRGELDFDGIVMADGLAVDRLEDMAGSIPAAGRAALLAGVDVSLWDKGFASLDRLADDPRVEEAVDRSVRRVLLLKDRFGLLPHDTDQHSRQEDNHGEDGPEHISLSADAITTARRDTRQKARRLSHECLVLLKNDGTIPQALTALAAGAAHSGADAIATATADKNDRQARSAVSETAAPAPAPAHRPVVAVVGPFADDFACFLGDYTAPVPQAGRTSVYRQLAQHLPGCDVRLVDDAAIDTDPRARQTLSAAHLIVGVWGGTSERSYTSSFASNGAAVNVGRHGATGGEGVDCADIALPWGQDATLEKIRRISTGLIVSIVVAGRAHVLTTVLRESNAVIWAGYAGVGGPAAVVDALVGACACTGRMPVTLVSDPGVVPVRYNDRQSAAGVYRDAPKPVLDWFGTGLGALHGLRIGEPVLAHHEGYDTVRVRVRAPERGDTPDAVCAGSLDIYRHVRGGAVIPRLRELVGSTYLVLAPGGEETVGWDIPVAEGTHNHYRIGEEADVTFD